MKKITVLSIAVGLYLLASFPTALKADGRDIAVSGKEVSAVIDDRTGKIYELLPEGKDKPFPSLIKEGATVSVFGDQIYKKGHLSIRVEKVQ